MPKLVFKTPKLAFKFYEMDPRIILRIITKPFTIYFYHHATFIFQLPSFVFSEEYQNELVENTAKAFNNQTFGVIGEMIWNFADFMTKQVRLIQHVEC